MRLRLTGLLALGTCLGASLGHAQPTVAQLRPMHLSPTPAIAHSEYGFTFRGDSLPPVFAPATPAKHDDDAQAPAAYPPRWKRQRHAGVGTAVHAGLGLLAATALAESIARGSNDPRGARAMSWLYFGLPIVIISATLPDGSSGRALRGRR
jgi:hypothetical protein